MSKIGIDQALRVLNDTLVTEAYGRVHAQMVIEPGILVDGIKPDGSFGQHLGLLYNGNYGKDLCVLVFSLCGWRYIEILHEARTQCLLSRKQRVARNSPRMIPLAARLDPCSTPTSG